MECKVIVWIVRNSSICPLKFLLGGLRCSVLWKNKCWMVPDSQSVLKNDIQIRMLPFVAKLIKCSPKKLRHSKIVFGVVFFSLERCSHWQSGLSSLEVVILSRELLWLGGHSSYILGRVMEHILDFAFKNWRIALSVYCLFPQFIAHQFNVQLRFVV